MLHLNVIYHVFITPVCSVQASRYYKTQFDVDVPGDCLSMWKSYHEQYRGEMSASLIGGDCTAKNKAAADEIYKKYKEV